VEDSASGIGAASNAGCGFIIGFVGSSYISVDMEEHHAWTLLSGVRSNTGVGADIVISDMDNLVPLVTFFRSLGDKQRPFSFPDALIAQLNNSGRVWLREHYEEAMNSGELMDMRMVQSQRNPPSL
jgi:hypothetical protein